MYTKHKKYTLIERLANKSIVQDVTTKELHDCFYVEDYKIGDEFYLYIRDINFYTGKPIFQYSILNTYEVDKEYTFYIEESKENVCILSDENNQIFPVPIYLIEDKEGNTVNLKVKKLELENNKLFFYSINNYDEINPKDFEESKIYVFKVQGDYFNKNGTRYVIISLDNKTYTTNLPSALNNVELDKEIPFTFNYFKTNDSTKLTPTFNVSIAYTSRKLFNVGEQYRFKIEQLVVDSEYGNDYWILRDSIFNIRFHYYLNNDFTVDKSVYDKNIDDEIDLYVCGYTKQGYLMFSYKNENIQSISYQVEDLFKSIDYAGQEDEYFFNIQSEPKTNNDNDSENQTYINQYNEGENLWVFSYLKFLDIEIFEQLREGDIDNAKTLVDIYIRIEDWILNKSDYLKIFNSETTRNNIIIKAKTKLKNYESIYKAMGLFIKNEDKKFIETSIKKRMDLFIDEEPLNIFEAIVNLNGYFNSSDIEIHEIVLELLNRNHLRGNDLHFYIKSLVQDIKQIHTQVISNADEIENIKRNKDLIALIQGQYILVILSSYENNHYKQIIASVNLLRYLTIYHDDAEYINLAIKLLVNKSFLAIENPRGNLPKAVEKDIAYFSEVVQKSSIVKINYTQSGFIELNGVLNFTPGNHNSKIKIKQKTIANLDEFNINLVSNIYDKKIQNDVSLNQLLHDILDIISFKNEKHNNDTYSSSSSEPILGKVKSNIKDNYLFVAFLLNNHEEESLFHSSNFNRSSIPYLNKLPSIIREGDFLKFKINDFDTENKHFSIGGIEIDNSYHEKAARLEKTDHKIVVFKVDDFGWNFAITENGYLVNFLNQNGKKGECYNIKLNEYSRKHGNFNGAKPVLLINEQPFDLVKASREYLIRTSFLIEGKPEDEVKEPDNNDYKTYFTLLVLCLEHKLNFIKDEKKSVKYYFFIALLSGILKSSLSFKYNEKLKRLKYILNLDHDNSINDLKKFISNSKFEFIDQSNQKILTYILDCADTEIIDIQIPIHNSSPIYQFKKLVESYNLIKKIEGDHTAIEYLISKTFKEILQNPSHIEASNYKSFLDNSDEEETMSMNLGREDKHKEFKSSFFHSASDKQQDDVVLKEIAGFLNAYEGTGHLYLGVNDNGDIIGIDEDLKYNPNITTIDKYLNHIQSKIANGFPKIINTIIDYKVHTVKNKEYLEIKIPSNESPIPYKGEFYQRQGVQTRILKGDDILDFFNKKSEVKITQKKTLLKNKDQVRNNKASEYQQLDLYTVYKKQTKEFNKQEINIEDKNLIACLYIYDNNTYSTSFDDSLKEYKYKISITEQYKNGYLLICYSNGCVNKVEVRSILNKKLNKIYKNAYYTESEIIGLFLVNNHDKVIVYSKRTNKKYIKVYNIDDISEYRHLFLKGNCILQDDFDTIVQYKTCSDFPEEYSNFHRKSRAGLGVSIDLYNPQHQSMMAWITQKPKQINQHNS